MANIELTINMIVQNEESIIENTLQNIDGVGDELVIVDGGSTDSTMSICKKYTDRIFCRTFDGNFGEQKTFANSVSKGRWIFNIDADEVMSQGLKDSIRELIRYNDPFVDLLWIPRINKVQGITPDLVERWGWTIDEDGDLNFPDPQGRLYKRKPEIKWVGRVHERINGFSGYGHLPHDKTSGMYLIHTKTVEKQMKQNALYEAYK